MDSKYIVTAQLGTDYYDTVLVRASNIYNAISDAISELNCSYEDIVSVTRID